MISHDLPYQTISANGTSEFKDRNSKFLGFAFEVNSEDEVKKHLQTIAEEHHKSRHVCYGFRLGKDGEIYRFSDDGEPSGSSGRPIYNQILSAELDNTLVAVCRYFGGSKLGIPGLINAYGEAAKMAILDAGTKVIKPKDLVTLKAGYGLMGKLMDTLKSTDGIEIVSQDFESGIQIDIATEKNQTEELIQLIKSKLADVPFDENRELEIEGLEILR